MGSSQILCRGPQFLTGRSQGARPGEALWAQRRQSEGPCLTRKWPSSAPAAGLRAIAARARLHTQLPMAAVSLTAGGHMLEIIKPAFY